MPDTPNDVAVEQSDSETPAHPMWRVIGQRVLSAAWRRVPKTPQQVLGELLFLVGISIVSVFGSGFMYLLMRLMHSSASRPFEFKLESERLVMALGVVFAGYVLFRMRQNRQRMYGVFEIAMGVALGYVAIPNALADPLTGSLSILGGVFLCVRGFDNVFKGRNLGPVGW